MEFKLTRILGKGILGAGFFNVCAEPATSRQLAYLRSLGVEFPEGITKEKASRLIDEATRGKRIDT